MIQLILSLVVSYFLGSFPTAFLVGRLVKKIDIRKYGSGNVGATNVFRVVGRRWGIAVLIFDALKGTLAVSLAPKIFVPSLTDPFIASLFCGITAIAGHTWTIWLGFKGGKGVATSAGVFLALAPKAAGTALLVWILVFSLKRYVSLASIVTAVTFPLWVVLFDRRENKFSVLFPTSLLLAVFILYTHRANIGRLKKGAEKKLL